jgi:hypothetical protein
MIGSRKGKIGLAAVTALALAAAGAAYATSKMHGSASSTRAGFGPPTFAGYGAGPGDFHGGRPGFGSGMRGAGRDLLDEAATYLGLSETDLRSSLASGKTLAQIANGTSGKSASGLIDALVSAEKDELAQAVKDGSLTQSRSDQIASSLKDRITSLVNGAFGRRGGPPPDMGRGPSDDLQAAAGYLGISATDLMTQLRSGKTLATIADATNGKSSSGLVDALVAHEQSELAQAVKDGKLTQAQADQLGVSLNERETAFVNGTHGRPGGFGRRGFEPGRGPGYGPGDDGGSDRSGSTPAQPEHI